jgi:hypothetical protein
MTQCCAVGYPPVRSDEDDVRYTIAIDQDIVRAELIGAESVEETKQFLRAVANYASTYLHFLFRVRSSKAIFRLEQQGLIESLHEVARSPSHRIAWLADGWDLQIAFEYLELLARQHTLNVRSFRSESHALQWLGQQTMTA